MYDPKDFIIWQKISELLAPSKFSLRKNLKNTNYEEKIQDLLDLVSFWIAKQKGLKVNTKKIKQKIEEYEKSNN
jgi:hypothetical protein